MSIPDRWKFPGRDYSAAKDHISSLLNFGYYVLEQEIWAAYGHMGPREHACRTRGLARSGETALQREMGHQQILR